MTLFFGWLVVVGLATTLTWQIVSAADDQVSERPIAPLNVAAPALADTSSTIATTTTSLAASATTTTTLATPTTSSPKATVATSTTTSSSTTATSPPTTEATWQTRSVQTAGGTVILRYRPGEVTYQSATPAPGYQVEVEKPGPPEVRMEFESESRKVEVEASWQDDGLDVHVSTEDED
jgi:cytoskeletal protein RodZ